MRLKLICIHRLIAIMVLLGLQPGSVAASSNRIPVEVWCGGDDGLTLKLRDALETSFESSTDFQLSTGKKPGTLFVTIPTHVKWKQRGGRYKLLYTIEFRLDNLLLGPSTGSCWEDELAKCTDRILKNARRAVRRGRHP